jgi:hypothetical protein
MNEAFVIAPSAEFHFLAQRGTQAHDDRTFHLVCAGCPGSITGPQSNAYDIHAGREFRLRTGLDFHFCAARDERTLVDAAGQTDTPVRLLVFHAIGPFEPTWRPLPIPAGSGGRFKWASRNSMGSAPAAAAISSINDSRANEFAVEARARYDPCRNGGREPTLCDRFRGTLYGESIDVDRPN